MTNSKKTSSSMKNLKTKLTAAIAMVLVSCIMLVSSTYAWFTLSTAPEVTGITTSVGANGSLEIALLTTETFANTSNIASGVGDSSANQAVTAANITWGNLIDLSDSVYGLSDVKLMPAALGDTLSTGLLKTPVYGADGRVASLETKVVSAVKSGSSFVYDSANPTYGVRAVGISSNISAAQIAFNNAKSAFTSSTNTAKNPVTTAVNANASAFVALALAGTAESYSQTQIDALIAIADGAEDSLKKVVNAYSNAAYAAAISKATEDQQETVATAAASLMTNTDAGNTLLTTYGGTYTETFTALKTAQDAIAAAKTVFENYHANETAATADQFNTENEAAIAGGTMTAHSTPTQVNTSANSLIGNKDGWTYKTASGADSDFPTLKKDMNGKIYLAGVLQTIADYTGTFKLTTLLNVEVHAGTPATTGASTTVSAAVNALTSPAGESTSNITDTYGYVLDFAFRTNAADSYLQLQTEAKNRVYSGETDANLATQGSGSNVTYTYADGLTAEQATTQLGAIRIVFFDPETGTIHATAQITDVTASGGSATGNIKIVGAETTKYVLGKNAYTSFVGHAAKATVTVDEVSVDVTGGNITSAAYDALEATTTKTDGAVTYGKDAYESEMTENLHAPVETSYGTPTAGITDEAYQALADSTTKAADTYTFGKDAYEATETQYAIKDSFVIEGKSVTKASAAATDASTNYKETLTTEEYNALAATGSIQRTNAEAEAKITALTQNAVAKISVLVYMNGDLIDNGDVINASTSGNLTLNLQFSSSATLIPMENTDLKTKTK